MEEQKFLSSRKEHINIQVHSVVVTHFISMIKTQEMKHSNLHMVLDTMNIVRFPTGNNFELVSCLIERFRFCNIMSFIGIEKIYSSINEGHKDILLVQELIEKSVFSDIDSSLRFLKKDNDKKDKNK